MTNHFKEGIRRCVFWAIVLFDLGDEFVAYPGTLKFKFLNWLYDGGAEPEFDCQWPEDEL